jgi:superfamily II DNA or RNA helicase
MPSQTPPCSVKVGLRDHQTRIVNALLTDRPNMLFVAGTGSGKTISAIVSGVCLLANRKVTGVVIVTPTGVHEQFAREVRRLVPSVYQKAFTMHTHHSFFQEDTDFRKHLRGKLLVVDEAHAMATQITKEHQSGQIKNGKMAYHATVAAHEANQVLLLTATPIKNNPTELFNLACMVRQQPYEAFYREHAAMRSVLMKLFGDYLRTGNEYMLQRKRRQNLLAHAYAQKMSPLVEFASFSREGFPQCNDAVKRLTMTGEYLELYNRVESEKMADSFSDVLDRSDHQSTAEQNGVPLQLLFDPNKASCFFSKVRVAVNGITENVTSQKVKYTLDLIQWCQRRGRRVLVYSNFLNGGLSLVARRLGEMQIPFMKITGSLSASNRQECVELMNSGVVKVLLISAAGSEGLDLKCVRDVVILEPHFHDVRIEQVIGRAVRFRSHDSLPPEDRNVTVHRLLLCKPTESGETWEAIESHNIKQVQRLVRTHMSDTRETRKGHIGQPIHLNMHPMYKALVENTILAENIPRNRFFIFTHRKDHTITVSRPGRFRFFTRVFRPDIKYHMKAPPTDISVDDLLHRMSVRKKRFLTWHLNQIKSCSRDAEAAAAHGGLQRRCGRTPSRTSRQRSSSTGTSSRRGSVRLGA